MSYGGLQQKDQAARELQSDFYYSCEQHMIAYDHRSEAF